MTKYDELSAAYSSARTAKNEYEQRLLDFNCDFVDVGLTTYLGLPVGPGSEYLHIIEIGDVPNSRRINQWAVIDGDGWVTTKWELKFADGGKLTFSMSVRDDDDFYRVRIGNSLELKLTEEDAGSDKTLGLAYAELLGTVGVVFGPPRGVALKVRGK